MDLPSPTAESDERGLIAALVKDGRPLITLTGLALLFSGCFALFLSVRGEFLPHDVRFLGLGAHELCSVSECRVVYFMFHDRVAFGGALIAIGILYMWLAEFPLGRGEPWSWWALLASGTLGFGSFLAYLGYGYLDSWHGVATLALLPLFAAGLVRSFPTLQGRAGPASVLRPGFAGRWNSMAGIGRLLLLATGAGMILGGGTIMIVGMTTVFVPQDLAYMRLSSADLHAIHPRLVPLIAHDRAGFGGGIASCGLAVLLCAWCAHPCRSLWQALACAGGAGFGTAIGVHFVIGYTDVVHLAPAYAGLAMFALGLGLAGRGRSDFSGSGATDLRG